MKGFSQIWIIVGIIVFAAIGGVYYFGFDHGWEKSVKTTEQTKEPTPSSSGKFKQITFSDKWIKHQPSCRPLANNIEIYYPDNWLPKEFEDVRDDIQVCYILFGYPVQPQGYQDTTPNQLVEFRIHAFLKKEQTFDQYIDAIKKQDPTPIKVSKVMINNREYTRFDFEKKCCADASTFYTSKGQIFFRIQAVNSYGYTGSNFDQPFELNTSVIESLNNEFLNKIKIL